MMKRGSMAILVADDDPDDRALARDALFESRLLNPVHFVNDGVELLEFLQHRGRFADSEAPRPAVILIDLNMPRIGRARGHREDQAGPRAATDPDCGADDFEGRRGHLSHV